jgi:hypothetical protein
VFKLNKNTVESLGAKTIEVLGYGSVSGMEVAHPHVRLIYPNTRIVKCELCKFDRPNHSFTTFLTKAQLFLFLAITELIKYSHER